MRNIKLNSTYNAVFLLVSSVNHITGVVSAAPVVQMSKAGGSFYLAQGQITELGFGWYSVQILPSDSNTPGELIIHVEAANCDPCDLVYNVGAEGISAAVKTSIQPELDIINNTINGLTPQQETMLLEIYRLMGLDPTKPLVVTQTNRSAGPEIMQTIVGNESITTVTRQ